MSDKARKLIKRAIQIHLDEDGASNTGAYRDIVTEVLHFAYKEVRKKTSKIAKPSMAPPRRLHPRFLDYLNNFICAMGFEEFQEELENAEVDKVNKIPDEKLPLHSVDEFEFDVAKTQFMERLKTEKKYFGGKVPELLNLRTRLRKGKCHDRKVF